MTRRFFSGTADREADEEKEFSIVDSEGLWGSDYYNETTVPDNGFVESLNVVPGTMKQRIGFNQYFTSAYSGSQMTGLHSYQRHTATPELLYTFGGALYRNSTRTSIETGLTTSVRFEFTTFSDDQVYYVNGIDSIRVYNGTTAAAVSAYTPSASEPANFLSTASHGVHDCTCIETHDKVMYVGGPSSAPYRFYRCDEVVGPTYWHHYIDVVSKRGGKIRGLKSFGNSLIILKSDSIWAMDGFVGDKTINMRCLHADIGCAAGRTAQEVPGMGLVFLGSDSQFHLLRRSDVDASNIQLFQLSKHIASQLQNVSSFYYDSVPYGPCAGVYKGVYFCSVAVTGVTYKILAFDSTKTKPMDAFSYFVPWSVWTSTKLRFTAYANHFTGSANLLIAADAVNDNLAYNTFLGSPAGSDIVTSPVTMTATIETKNFDFGQIHRMKYVPSVRVKFTYTLNASTLRPYVSVDNGTYVTLDTVSMYSGATNVRGSNAMGVDQLTIGEAIIPVHKYGKQFRFKFTHDTANSTMELHEIRVRYSFEEVR